jgi:predicted nucleic acid-binding protein
MLAVSNTSPISNLAIIGKLDLLKAQFPQICIPAAVAGELAAHPDPTASQAIEAAFADGWVRVVTVRQTALLNILATALHAGEAEAIALGVELEAAVVLIDEQEGRQYAKQAGLSVTGILGIHTRARLTGHIPAVKPLIEELRDKARFFVSATLEAQVLSSVGE